MHLARRARMHADIDVGSSIDRLHASDLDPLRFATEYLQRNKPVIITGAATPCHSMRRWAGAWGGGCECMYISLWADQRRRVHVRLHTPHSKDTYFHCKRCHVGVRHQRVVVHIISVTPAPHALRAETVSLHEFPFIITFTSGLLTTTCAGLCADLCRCCTRLACHRGHPRLACPAAVGRGLPGAQVRRRFMSTYTCVSICTHAHSCMAVAGGRAGGRAGG